MMVSLQSKYGYKMAEDELQSYVSLEEDRVIAKLKESLRPCVGVDAEFVPFSVFIINPFLHLRTIGSRNSLRARSTSSLLSPPPPSAASRPLLRRLART